MKQQCPKCSNWVEGGEKQDFSRKITKNFIKKGSSVATGAMLGSIVPGLGTMIGGAVGLVLGTLIENDVNKAADTTGNFFLGEAEYEFKCPNCGYCWAALGSSNENSQEVKDQELFQQYWTYFLENNEEILSSCENVNAFISELEYKQIISVIPKAKFYFLIAWCSYLAIGMNNQYYSISQKYINRALRTVNDNEYHLFTELLNNRVGSSGISGVRDSESIVRNSLHILNEIDENSMLLKKEYYLDELKNAISEEVQSFKSKKILKAKRSFIKESIFCVPTLLFTSYKYINNDSDGWDLLFERAFSWFFLLIVGGLYLVYICVFIPILSKSDEEWKTKMIDESLGFSFSDLFK